MTSLAVFDFDRTIVDADSDATIISALSERTPAPEWDSTNNEWTPYMSNVFQHAYSAGMHPDDILACIASMPPTPGVEGLLQRLAAESWHVLLLTDANSVFVEHWLKVQGLEDKVTAVITNRAFFDRGRLFIEPCMDQTFCRRCPRNLCKSLALAQHCDKHPPYFQVVYVGDGRNDFCPAASLTMDDIVFPRSGYPLENLIKKTVATRDPEVVANVVPWDHCDTILDELFN